MSHLDEVTTPEAIFLLFAVVARPRFNGLMRNISPNGCVFMESSRDGEDRESGGLIDWQWWGEGWEIGARTSHLLSRGLNCCVCCAMI